MSSLEADDPAIWDNARAYANLLGQVPSSFSTGIRALKVDGDKNQPISRGSAFQVGRLVQSPSLESALLFATKTYLPEEYDKRPSLTGKDLLSIHSPETLACLISAAYLYRRAKKLANEDEWSHYTKTLFSETDIGGAAGFAIPKIGGGKGILVGCADTIALTCYHLHDKKGFTEYRRTLKQKNVREDRKHEIDRWGCTRYHIGAILLQGMGLGIEFSNSYAVGCLATEQQEKNLPPDAYTFYITRVWARALELTCAEPNRAMRADYYPEKGPMAHLRTVAESIKKSGSKYQWLDRTKTDAEDPVEVDEEPASA